MPLQLKCRDDFTTQKSTKGSANSAKCMVSKVVWFRKPEKVCMVREKSNTHACYSIRLLQGDELLE